MAASAALHAEYEARLSELRAAAEADIGTRLDAAMQRILAANKSMEAELALHIAVGVNSEALDLGLMKILQSSPTSNRGFLIPPQLKLKVENQPLAVFEWA